MKFLRVFLLVLYCLFPALVGLEPCHGPNYTKRLPSDLYNDGLDYESEMRCLTNGGHDREAETEKKDKEKALREKGERERKIRKVVNDVDKGKTTASGSPFEAE